MESSRTLALTSSVSNAVTPANMSLLERIAGRLDSLELKVEGLRELLIARRKDFYTVDEVADIVGRSAFTVRRWITEGRLHATRIEGTGPRGKLLVPRAG